MAFHRSDKGKQGHNFAKILAVFYETEDGALLKTSYVFRKFAHVSLKGVCRDLCRLLHLESSGADVSDCQLFDLSGKKVGSMKALYRSSASLFLFRSPTSAVSGQISTLIDSGAFAQRPADRSGIPSWIFGKSTLLNNVPVPQHTKDVVQTTSTTSSGTAAVENDRTETNEFLEKLRLTPATEPADNSRVEQQPTDSQLHKTTSEEADMTIVSKPESSPTEVSSNFPKKLQLSRFNSQINDKADKIRHLQEKMVSGESFLDKIGRRTSQQTPQRPRNPYPLFGDALNDSGGRTSDNHRPVLRQSSAIATWSIPVGVDEKPRPTRNIIGGSPSRKSTFTVVGETSDEQADQRDDSETRPKTMTLKRNPTVS